MDARLQRRVQRYGWDLAASSYDPLWQRPLAQAQSALLAASELRRNQRVLDVACGTGLVTFEAARAVGNGGQVLGIDLSAKMLELARARMQMHGLVNTTFVRMDAEQLELPDAAFNAALCALGLMYLPDPAQALCEMRRVLEPGGRVALAVWGERAHCGWSAAFPIVEAEVASEVCPLFFQLGGQRVLSQLCRSAGFVGIEQRRIGVIIEYPDAAQACDAAFVGGPLALAWSRFSQPVRARVRARYIESIERWRHGSAYAIPGEFVIVSALTTRRTS